METVAQGQENIVQVEEIEQVVERCLERRMAQLIPPVQPQGLSPGVEAELRHQRELMQQGFEAMAKRFEAVDKRFEELRSDMNQRFEMLIALTDKRFEAADKRFSFMQWVMVAGFGLLAFMMSLYKFFP